MTGPESAATDYFNRWKPELFGEELWYQRTYNRLTTGLVRGNTLDLGCGARVYYNVEAVDRWVGLDLSTELLDQLLFFEDQRPREVEKRNISCWDLPFPDESFDTVCAMFLFHHLAKTSRRESRRRVLEVMADVRRVLKPDGVFLIGENAARLAEKPYHLAYRPLYWLFRRFSVELPYFWSVNEWVKLIEDAGFDEPSFCHIPVREGIINPMSGITLPTWVMEILQRMSLFVIRKPASP